MPDCYSRWKSERETHLLGRAVRSPVGFAKSRLFSEAWPAAFAGNLAPRLLDRAGKCRRDATDREFARSPGCGQRKSFGVGEAHSRPAAKFFYKCPGHTTSPGLRARQRSSKREFVS